VDAACAAATLGPPDARALGKEAPADATCLPPDAAPGPPSAARLAAAGAAPKGRAEVAVGLAPPEAEDNCQPGAAPRPCLGADAAAEAASPVEPAEAESIGAGGPPEAPPSLDWDNKDTALLLNAGSGTVIAGPPSDGGITPEDEERRAARVANGKGSSETAWG
jgi:hypothetical protein